MAQLKVTLETSADEQEVGREELNEKAVQNTSLRRRVEERKRQDTSVLLGWNDLQKFIYGKRMLKGAARQFISFEREIKSWDSLKRSLIREFQVKVNSATIHKQLSKRRQQPGESSRLYIYSMQEIANQGNIEEDALIQYIADGLLGERRDKAVLYGSRTLTEFKNNIQIFDKLKESNVQGTRFRKDNQGNVASTRIGRSPAIKKGHCYGCGSEAHSYRFCPDKEKGLKCFKCNNFGHIASHCNKSQQPSENKASINCVQSTTDRVAIRINGFGNAITKPIGRCEVNIDIEDGRYKTDVFVVSQSDMRYEVLLGRELLKELDVRINKGRVEIRRPDKRLSEEISEGSVKSSDYDTDEIDVKEPYKVRIKELIQNYKPNTKPDARTETKIKLTDNIPVCSKPRRLAPKEKKIVTQQLDEWLDEGIIQPSTSEYSSPVVVVPKKDGTYRVCIDYRKLNAKVVRDRFPMPLIEDCLDALTQGVVFSTIDLKNGFFHVKIEEDSRKFTSFVTPDGQFEFLRTPFGLCSSPASFLRFIDEVFGDLVRKKIVLTYMDDLIIPGIDYEDACKKLEITLTVAAQNGLIINWKKCKFLREEIEFLGHVVWNGSIRPSPTKVKAVQRFPEPKNRKQIQSFLGLTGYFRKFIKDYAKIARPLSDLLKAGKAFVFDTAERESYSRLKYFLSQEPVLRIYDPGAMTELHTDASIDGFGAVLLQKYENENNYHPVHYMSYKTSEAERKYHSYELEVLAIIKAVQKFRVYLLGIRFKLVTDCQAFQKTLKKRELAPKVARWALSLEEFDFEVEHRPGERMKHVDALSRYPVMCIEDTLLQNIRKKQEEEERLRVIRLVVEKEPYEDYILENNILMKRVNDKNVIVLPTSMQSNIIRKIHENGHFSTTTARETLEKLGIQQRTFGNPTRIITDKGTAFTATEFKEYCMTERVEHVLTTTGIPRGNGQVERINRIIISVLTKMSMDAPDKWYKHVDKVQRAINSTYQRSVDASPFEVMFGVKMKQREDLAILELIEKEAILQYSDERLRLREATKESLLKIQEENRRNYNRKCKKASVYNEGDLVAIKRTQFGAGLKIQKKFLGPYKISRCKRNNRYEVIRVGGDEGPKITTTAADYMKPFEEFPSGAEGDADMAECGKGN
ncbi:uncharacterized protein LOC122526637 [Polistes fuscatus]|uniref:uncharacterized protein LOC122526637 n=1 Tax=Polistes fuscatus TaxID=30207 RepID=UPI001CA7D633|nr:uncharacterized protein LOC122526637 [Polistes fuscatus]